MGVELHELAENDLCEISALIARVFGRSTAADGDARLHWLLFENPAVRVEIPKGWVLREGGRPVGFLANVLRQMVMAGADVLAACTARFVVLPTHRFHGLLLAKAFYGQTGVDLLLCSTASRESVRVLRRFGARDIAGGDGAALFILRGRPVAAEVLRRRGYHGPVARAAAAAVGGVASLMARAGFRRARVPADIQIEPMSRFDGAVDRLWERCRGDHPIASRRNAVDLNWLFVDGPKSRPPTLILGAWRGTCCEGYVVCQERGQTQGVRRCEVMDLFSPRGDSGVFDALLRHALVEARQAGMDTLEFRNLPQKRLDRIVSWGARRRRLEVNPFLAAAPAKRPELFTDQAQIWYLVPSDGDGAAW